MTKQGEIFSLGEEWGEPSTFRFLSPLAALAIFSFSPSLRNILIPQVVPFAEFESTVQSRIESTITSRTVPPRQLII